MKKKQTLLQRVKALELQVKGATQRGINSRMALGSDLTRVETRVANDTLKFRELQEQLSQVQNRLKNYELAFGPLWETADGYLVTPSMMSDNHLENLERRDFGTFEFQSAVMRERNRRDADDGFHRLSNKLSPRVLIAKIAKRLRWIL